MATTTERLRLPGGDLHTRLTERGLRVTLEDWRDLEIELRPRVRVMVLGPGSAFWDLSRAERRAGGPDPFLSILSRLEDRLAPLEEPSPAASRLLLRATAMLRRASAHGVARCDPVVRRAALVFAPMDRLQVYSLLANDRTGRLLQASTSVPGALLVLRFALQRGGDFPRIGAAMLHDLLAGRRLEPMLDEAVAGLQLLPRELWYSVDDPTGKDEFPPYVVPGHGHRHLIRHAGPEADAWFLAQPPPFPIVPEEIPSEPAGRRAWYSLAAVHAMRFVEEAPSPQDFRMAGFLSRHAALLGKHAKQLGGGLRSLLDELEIVASRTGRAPGPRSDPAKVLAKIVRRQGDDEAFEYARAAKEVEASGGYPAPPFPADRSAAWEVWPIVSLDDLREEGRTQRNCALTWFDRVLLGESAFYAARLGTRRLTLVINRRPGQPWRLGQAVAFANARATAVDRRVLERWLAKVSVR